MSYINPTELSNLGKKIKIKITNCILFFKFIYKLGKNRI